MMVEVEKDIFTIFWKLVLTHWWSVDLQLLMITKLRSHFKILLMYSGKEKGDYFVGK